MADSSESLHKEAFDALLERAGEYDGEGTSHDGGPYAATFALTKRLGARALRVEARAEGAAKVELHREESTLALRPDGSAALWVVSTNHPGVVEHVYDPAWPPAEGAERTLAFRAGAPGDLATFREVVCFDLWPDLSITHRYAWAEPGQELVERSAARLVPRGRRPVPEAPLVASSSGMKPGGPGWFVVNVARARWMKHELMGRFCPFESPEHRFEHLGVNVHVLEPGQPSCHYHAEADAEAFLVLAGRPKLLVEGEERILEPWDFFYCAPWTRHVFVGGDEGAAAILMIGARERDALYYPATDLARRYKASAPFDTPSPQESYQGLAKSYEAPAAWPL